MPAQAHTSSFYHLRDVDLREGGHACRGLACFAARHDDPARWQSAQRGPRIHCLGQCDRAPSATRMRGEPPPTTAVHVQVREPVLLRRIAAGGARELGTFRRLGGGAGWAQAQRQAPGELIRAIQASELRGRGGAGFPTGRKWAAVAQQPGSKTVVVNADEGDAGSFSDRVLIEQDPFALIEGLRIAAYAVGARDACIYLRKEYPDAEASLRHALQQVRRSGWLPDFDVELVIGQGSYVAGEETAMLNSIEGRRAQARAQPPRVFEQGLLGAPTLVDNVETLCSVPWIVEHGAAAYAALGTAGSRGTKLLSLNSLFRRPGVHEVEFGIPLRTIVDDLGGGLRRGSLRALMVGGPLAGLLPPSLLDTRLGFDEMHAAGGAVGHGGVIAFADDSTVIEIAAEVFAFGAGESCARCVPCHRGTAELARRFRAALDGTRGDAQSYHDIVDALAKTSLCGHGRGLAEFAASLQRHFSPELNACLS